MRLLKIALLLAACTLVSLGSQANAQLTQAALTNTSQLRGGGSPSDVIAAVNLRYATAQADALPGSVNGYTFQNVDWTVGSVALTNGGTLGISPSFAGRQRFQNTAASITGTNDTILESVVNTINFFNSGEQVTFNMTGLKPNQQVLVHLLGGDAGTNLGNWFGDLNVTANGSPVGLWNVIADDNDTTASIASFVGTTNALGQLSINLQQVNPPSGGPFVGLGGFTVLATPEPSTWVAMLLMAPALLVAGWFIKRKR